jgi:hypothetical protein
MRGARARACSPFSPPRLPDWCPRASAVVVDPRPPWKRQCRHARHRQQNRGSHERRGPFLTCHLTSPLAACPTVEHTAVLSSARESCRPRASEQPRPPLPPPRGDSGRVDTGVPHGEKRTGIRSVCMLTRHIPSVRRPDPTRSRPRPDSDTGSARQHALTDPPGESSAGTRGTHFPLLSCLHPPVPISAAASKSVTVHWQLPTCDQRCPLPTGSRAPHTHPHRAPEERSTRD